MRFLFPLFLLWGVSAMAAENLIDNAGFQVPFVNGRIPWDKGGDPTKDQFHGWVNLGFQGAGKKGSIIAGMTNEIQHNTPQSFYVRFNYVGAPYQSVFLTSNFLPVAPGTDYKVGISGIMDPKDPMSMDGRSVYLKVEVDYFAKDGNTSVGEPFYAVQPIPGSRNHPPDFKTDEWYQFHVKVTTPADAVFAQVTFRWETGSSPGEGGDNSGETPSPGGDIANGTLFFDDAFFFGPPPPNPDLTPEPAHPLETGTAGASGTDMNATPAESPAGKAQ